jgi:hypothetical protein
VVLCALRLPSNASHSPASSVHCASQSQPRVPSALPGLASVVNTALLSRCSCHSHFLRLSLSLSLSLFLFPTGISYHPVAVVVYSSCASPVTSSHDLVSCRDAPRRGDCCVVKLSGCCEGVRVCRLARVGGRGVSEWRE